MQRNARLGLIDWRDFHPSAIWPVHRLGQFNLSVLPVVDRRDITRVLGEVTLEDLLEAYRNASA